MPDEPSPRALLERHVRFGAIEVAALAGRAHARESDDGEPLFTRGDPEAGLFLVREGEYKLGTDNGNGREQLVRLVDAGRLVIEGWCGANARCAISCIAIGGPARAWGWTPQELRAAIREAPGLALVLADALAARLGRMHELVHELSLRSVEQRLAAFVLARVHDDGHAIRRALPVHVVAALLGTTREEITRAQRRLQRAGLIVLTRHDIEVRDPIALARVAEGG